MVWSDRGTDLNSSSSLPCLQQLDISSCMIGVFCHRARGVFRSIVSHCFFLPRLVALRMTVIWRRCTNYAYVLSVSIRRSEWVYPFTMSSALPLHCVRNLFNRLFVCAQCQHSNVQACTSPEKDPLTDSQRA